MHKCLMTLQGRGSGFPGKRRPRGGGSGSGGGRGRGRSRLKAMASCIDAFLVSLSLYGVFTLSISCFTSIFNCISHRIAFKNVIQFLNVLKILYCK